MKTVFVSLLITTVLFTACKKEQQPSTMDQALIGRWTWWAQYRGAPQNTLTPQNTGISEILIINPENNWGVDQNGSTVSRGAYRTSVETNSRGEKVNTIYFRSETSTTDSVTYYKLYNDTLVFSHDFMGTTGSGARYYIRKN